MILQAMSSTMQTASNPVTRYLAPVYLGLAVVAVVLIALHRWDVKREQSHDGATPPDGTR